MHVLAVKLVAEGACSSREKRFLSENYDAGRLEHDVVATA